MAVFDDVFVFCVLAAEEMVQICVQEFKDDVLRLFPFLFILII